jgi:predicted enzyme related to lactoylglutathione lyase
MNLLVLRCSDFERSLRFYKALGLRFQRFRFADSDSPCAQAFIPGPDFALTKDDPGAEIPCTCLQLLTGGGGTVTRGLAFGFFVVSVDDSIEAVQLVEGKILTPAAGWPYGRMAAVGDPDGNRVELSEAPAGRLTGDFR